ncbi:MAG: UDP-forming cellulose synthase catalytic subunit [Algiphilus sp.]|uniref:UDP-forming cellulose synthase catalytic subunit n=3 Tax=Algiphilus sp. TaxID=1872431 RepID=UPI002A64BBB0|nr:UDP-forming cellulose synthase catalytic subunit [Pseudomonadota bacterium]
MTQPHPSEPVTTPLGLRLLGAIAVVLMAAVGWLFITTDLPLSWQMVVGVSTVLAAIIIKRLPAGHGPSYALMAISTLTTTRYIYWRVTETLPIGINFDAFDLAFAIGLLLAELYAWAILVLGFFQVLRPLQRKPVPLPDDPGTWPTVDVYIPTYNESLDVVRPTVIAALDLDWPADKLRIYVLDDGHREEFKAFCAEVGAIHVSRPDNRHAKAGNINHALTQTDGEYVAIFDADHIPTRSFLQVTMGVLVADPRTAMVQTPHHFFSADPFERNLGVFRDSPNEGELFYGLLQDGNDYWNATFFCGSCAVMRRTALEEVGGVAVETVTEDAHTALKMHRRGWRTAYINIPQAAGLATESLSAHVGQRIRWARGMAQIFRIDNPMLGRGLKLGQRLCYSTAMMHFFYGFPRLVFLTAPLAFLLLDARIINAQGWMILSFALPHLLCAIETNSRLQGRYRHSFFAEVYETVLATFIILPTTVALLRPKSGAFNVTAKGGTVDRDYFDKDIAKPYLWMFLLNVTGVIVGLIRLIFFDPDVDTLYVTMGWTIFNLILIGAAIRVASEKRQVRHSVRVACEVPVAVRREGDEGPGVLSTTRDLAYGGVALSQPAEHALQEGERVEIALIPDFAEVWTPGTLARANDDMAVVRLDPLTLQQEHQLVYTIYGRADAWLRWRNRARVDKPWRAFAHVLHFGYEGLIIFLKWMFSSFASLFTRRLAQPHLLLAAALLLGALGAASPALAQDEGPDTVPLATPLESQRSITLTDLGAEGTIRLPNARNQRVFPLSLRADQVVTEATLALEYRYSPALREDISQITVRLNGESVDSWRLEQEREQPVVRRIDIEPKLFLPYNELTVETTASYARDECEDPTHPSLWVELDPASSLDLELAHLRLQRDLAQLPAPFFDPGDARRLRLPISVPATTSADVVESGVTIASWFGLLADWRGAEFPVHRGRLSDAMHSIALRTSARDIPGFEDIPVADVPEIRIAPHPREEKLLVLLISAPDGDGLRRATQALAYGAISMSGEQARITGYTPPEALPANAAPSWLTPGDRVGLASQTRDGLSVRGMTPAPLRFDFRLPPHLYMLDRSALDLRFTARVSDAANPRSTLNVRFNGQFMDDTTLDDGAQRAIQRTMRTRIPVSAVEYRNRLELDFNLLRQTADHCDPFDPDALQGSIDRDITFDFPRHAYYAQLPDLGMLAGGAFPFSRYPDGAGTGIVLPSAPGEDALSATFTLAGFIGQNTGTVLSKVEVISEGVLDAGYDRDLLYVGRSDQLDIIRGERIDLPLTIRGEEVSLARIDPLFRWVARMDGRDVDAAYRFASRAVHSAGTRIGTIVGAESPFASGRSVVIVTAGVNGSAFDMARTLIDPGARQFIRGDVALLNKDNVSSYALGPQYSVGSLPWDWSLRLWVRSHPWTMLPLLIIATLLAIWILNIALRARAQRRLHGDE